MKHWAFLAVLAGLALVWYVSTRSRETFVSEFTDKTNVKRTFDTAKSSYAQQTNHVIPTKGPEEPIGGMETPFRVNQFNSFQPV